MKFGATPAMTPSTAAARASQPARGAASASWARTSAGERAGGAAAAGSAAAIGDRPLAVVAPEAAGGQGLGVVAVDGARDAVAGGEEEVEQGGGEPQAGLDPAAPLLLVGREL